MYIASDPRSKLSPATAAKPSLEIAPANIARFYEAQPQEQSETQRNWYARGQNCVLAYSETQPGAVFERTGQPDEFVLLLPDASSRAVIDWQGGRVEAAGHSIVFVPPGRSRIEMKTGGRLVRLFTTASSDIVALCPPGYEGDPNVPPLEPWPEPVDGDRVRVYSMDIAQDSGRLGRIFRSRNFMINYIYPRSGPRARSSMSPHSHTDFQQYSLSLEGSYVHHLRWPWGNDADLWREDEHELCHSPSLTVIPAQVIHTSEATGKDTNFLIDIFCPPRHDFSQQPGWVLNADEYPEPQSA